MRVCVGLLVLCEGYRLDRKEATAFLSRTKRANTWHHTEELSEAVPENECIEEICDFSELEEISDDREIAMVQFAGYSRCWAYTEFGSKEFRACVEKVLNDVPTLDVLYGEYESNNEFNVSSDSNSNLTESIYGHTGNESLIDRQPPIPTETSWMTTTTPILTTTETTANLEQNLTQTLTTDNVSWLMTKEENAYEYFRSIGVGMFTARLVSKVTVEHYFEYNGSELVIGAKTSLQSIEQKFVFDTFVTMMDPLRKENIDVKIEDKGSSWSMETRFASGIVAYGTYKLHNGNLEVTRWTNNDDTKAIWVYMKKERHTKMVVAY